MVLQGTQSALNKAANLESIVAVHNVPLALILQAELQDVLLLQDSESALLGERMRIEGWFGDNGPEQTVSFSDESSEVKQDIADVVDLAFENIIQWDIGRYEGDLANDDIISIAQQPSVSVIRFNPVFEIQNNNARSHMKINNMATYLLQILMVQVKLLLLPTRADEDHGDFGTRVVANNDVINDGSTADRWSGHGTHVSCTVLVMDTEAVMQVLLRGTTVFSSHGK